MSDINQKGVAQVTVKPPPVDVAVEPVFIDVKTTQRLLGNISRAKLNELVRAGRINPHMIDGRVVFTPAEVRRFAATCPAWEPKEVRA
jgi:hypothetical protein